MENSDDKQPENSPERLSSRILLIWLAAIAAVIGLVMAQSGEISSAERSLNSIEELIKQRKMIVSKRQ